MFNSFTLVTLLAAGSLAPAALFAQTQWTPLKARLTQVSAAPDGTVWGIDSGSRIVRLKATYNLGRLVVATENWEAIPAPPAGPQPSGVEKLPEQYMLAVGSAKQIFALNVRGGVLYRWSGSQWRVANGGLGRRVTAISASSDGSVRVVHDSQAVILTACSGAGGQFDDWAAAAPFPLPRFDTDGVPRVERFAGLAGNQWAQTNRGLYYWDKGSWQPTGSTPDKALDFTVGADGALYLMGSSSLWAGTAVAGPSGTYTVSWQPIKGLPALTLATVVDKSRMWAISQKTGEVFVSHAN